MKHIKRLGAFLLAVLVTYFLAAVAATQSVVASLEEMGLPVTFGQRLGATFHDLLGMSPSFLPLIAVGLAIAFLVSAFLSARIGMRTLLYCLAGGAAVVAVHLGLQIAFDIVPVAAARSGAGLAIQGLAGVVGGLVFAKISPQSMG